MICLAWVCVLAMCQIKNCCTVEQIVEKYGEMMNDIITALLILLRKIMR